MAAITVDREISLVPYYPNVKAALPWYHSEQLCLQVDGRPEPYSRERLLRMYRWLYTHGQLFYIKYKGRLCGDICLQKSGEINIVVAEPWQNKGIGRRVVTAVAAMAAQQGYAQLFARIYSFNRQSQRMFLHAGFVQTEDELYALQLKEAEN
ncbi:MAG: GNAT family N-acetyltransferase [Oscillospiraceae bacterium]|nr:GNAT family N-acetyltransferase [Oscillospiraceae bacterium]